MARVVDPLGCVVRPPAAAPAPPPPDPADTSRPNHDEATFRPVVRAPAALPPPALLLRPLPRTTTIPVQPLPTPASDDVASAPEPRALDTRRVIPAALGAAWDPPRPVDVPSALNTPSDPEPSLPTSRPPDIQPARSRLDETPTAPSRPRADDSFKASEFIGEYAAPAPAPTPAPPPVEPPPDPAPVPSPAPVTSAPRRRESRTSPKTWRDEDVRTEDQAWDMLLTEPARPPPETPEPPVEKAAEEKPRPRRNRKAKKVQEDAQARADDDSFVEIHAIDEKPQPSSGDLVSISSPFEDVEPCSSYVAKSKKVRAAKSVTPERTCEVEKTVEVRCPDEYDPVQSISRSLSKAEVKIADPEPWPQLTSLQKSSDTVKEKLKSNTLIVTQSEEVEDESYNKHKESSKSRKSKSLSPYLECHKSTEKDAEVKDVYVIDSTKDEFPEIQITRGTKPRKKSPLPVEVKSEVKEKPIITEQPVMFADKPIKSWSSIAACKNSKKNDDSEKKSDFDDKVEKTHLDDKKLERVDKKIVYDDVAVISDDKLESSKELSLHEKLYELCKRTDIMVAECDAPTELNFVEEHHAVMHELPPLEPLDFALDDFKLEVMRDSLLEVTEAKLTSPICKINIDDILSSIKETTTKVIESSTFNLIDLEKVPARKEKGFSVIESHKITSQEIKIDDELKADEREAELMEKSSDDDNTSPVVSTDSDKEDKRTGASKIILPSTLKKSAKSKNSRRKKK